MSLFRGSSNRDRALAKLLGEIANLGPQAWARVQQSFDERDKQIRRKAADHDFHTYRNIMQ